LICKTQTFGKKENVSQYWRQDVGQWLFCVGPEVKLPCAMTQFRTCLSYEEERWRSAQKDQTIAVN
jgi:hypothetical protein